MGQEFRTSGVRRLLQRSAFSCILAGAIMSLIVTSGATATTGPAAAYNLQAVMSGSKIVIVRTPNDAPYIKPGGLSAVFQRGTVITFHVKNTSNKPLVPAVHVVNAANQDPKDHPLQYYQAQHAAQPGQSVDLQINFYFRAPFELVQLYHKKPIGKSVHINVT
jgi:hypothetical protein